VPARTVDPPSAAHDGDVDDGDPEGLEGEP
jgi:hypothetical protein